MFYKKDNIKLHYEVIGEGKEVFLIHGLGCDMRLMKGCMEEKVFLKNSNYKRIYIDLPGMGKSPAFEGGVSSDKILDILTCFIKDYTNDTFFLVGESYGGYLARGILSKLKEQVDGMVLICPVVIAKHELRNTAKKNVLIKDEEFLKTLSLKDKKHFEYYGVVLNEHTFKRYKEEIESGLKIQDNEFINKLNKKYDFSFDVDERIKNIKYDKPVLFIAGRQDACVGYEDLWKISLDYDKASFILLNNAGHNLQIEQEEIFTNILKNYFK